MSDGPTPRHAGRRDEDPSGLWRHVWFRKLVAGATALLAPTALYFWNESRSALHDIQSGKADIADVRYEIQRMKLGMDANLRLSEEQRSDLKADVSRVEAKVDRLDERLSRWFERAGRTEGQR